MSRVIELLSCKCGSDSIELEEIGEGKINYKCQSCGMSPLYADASIINAAERWNILAGIITGHSVSRPIDSKKSEQDYIRVTLVNGKILDFNWLCNDFVESNVGKELIDFRCIRYDTSEWIALATIPKSQIMMIEHIHSQKTLDKVFGVIKESEED